MRRQRLAREGQEKRENRQQILKKLCAALSLGVSMVKESRGVPRVTVTFWKANSHFDPTQTGLRTAPPH